VALNDGAEGLFTSKEVAEFLRLNPGTLDNWACQGTGPRFVKVGNTRRYTYTDLISWLESQPQGGEPEEW